MIKIILQKARLSLTALADTLNISRPTLDTYIETFDSGRKISNSFYQDIFEFLFEDSDISAEEFARRFQYLRDQYGMTGASARLGGVSKLKSGYSAPKTEYEIVLDEICKHIESDRISPETPKETYNLIMYTLNNVYPEFLDIIKFYQYYIGLRNPDDLDESQKKTYALLYKAMVEMKDIDNVDPIDVRKWLDYLKKKNLKKKVAIESIKDAIATNLEQLLDNKTDLIDQIDVNKVIDVLKKEIGG